MILSVSAQILDGVVALCSQLYAFPVSFIVIVFLSVIRFNLHQRRNVYHTPASLMFPYVVYTNFPKTSTLIVAWLGILRVGSFAGPQKSQEGNSMLLANLWK